MKVGITKLQVASQTTKKAIINIWVIIANVLAWPLTWYFLSEWLNGFPYHISLNLVVFFLAGLSSLLIAVLTVGIKAYRASQLNPVSSLKYE